MAKKTFSIRMANQSIRDAAKQLQRDHDAIIGKLIEVFAYIGESCVAIARNEGSYNDITGNLRSSVGYMVLHDGQQVVYGAPRKYKDGDTGITEAKTLLGKLQAKFPRGLVLIICAGMNYASYVEDVRGRTVLSPARLKAEQLAPRLLKQLSDNIQFGK